MDAVTALTPANEAALLAEATPDGPAGPLTPLQKLQALPSRKKMMLGVGLAGLLALLVSLVIWNRSVPMSPLFPQPLPDAEVGLVLDQLNKMGEAHQFGQMGGLIMVPAERVAEVRSKLATLGIPKSAPTGFEVLDKQSFGQSQMQERTNLGRALTERLQKNILVYSAVKAAEVNVALPQQNGFYREQDKPSAGVLLTLYPGRTLDRTQIAGITHMVAASVPGLQAKDVTLTDQDGNWLTQPDSELRSDLTAQQRAHQREVETRLLKRVNDILEPALGTGNLRATVTAELDFNQVESTSEAYSPNQGPDGKTIVRSQRSLESGPTTEVKPTGIPGAASNQPAAAAQAPVTASSPAPLQAAQASTLAVGARKENAINYEVDKTVELKRNSVGNIKRVNVAVAVNHRTTLDAKGKPTTAALPQEEMDKLTALVQEAVGFNKDRGDSVKVVNIPFVAPPKVEAEPTPVYKQPWLIDLLKVGGVPAAITLMALALIFGVIRPAIKPDPVPEPEQPPETLNEVVDEPPQLTAAEEEAARIALEAPRIEKWLVDARAMAKENPLAVANILRTWINGAEATA